MLACCAPFTSHTLTLLRKVNLLPATAQKPPGLDAALARDKEVEERKLLKSQQVQGVKATVSGRIVRPNDPLPDIC